MPSRPSPKRIAAAVALALATGVASSSWAAGLGRLTVQSALGQPLRAEVEISALTPAEAASLNARLAPADAFRQAGLQFNPALSNLRFAIDRRANGSSVVRITSAQPINEPFVDLLVELNWASGRFVREYTFLLDPPELRTAAREVVEGGAVVRNEVVPPAVAASVQQEVAAAHATPSAATAPAQSSAAAETPAAAARARRAAAREAAAAEAAARRDSARQATAREASSQAGGSSVEVRGGETLAAIASRVKPASVSLDQALIAIYQANPGAFFGGVHQLRSGATLAIPDEQAMASVDAGGAREQVRAHTRDFNAYRTRLAERARTVAAASAGQSAEGRIGATVQERGAAEAGDQLRLSRSTPGAEATGAGATGTAATRAAEQGVARDAAVREAQSRVSDLEKNVANLQQLLELKNRQLAELQKQVEAAGAAGQTAAGAIAPQAAAGSVSTAPAAPAAPAASAVDSSAAPVSAQPAGSGSAASAQAQGSSAPAGSQAADSNTAAPAADAASAAAASDSQAAAPSAASAQEAQQADSSQSTAPVQSAGEAPAAVPAATPAPAKVAAQPSLMDDVMSNPLMLPGLAAILALGAGYGWYSMRRRRKVEKFEDSLIAADGFATNSLFGSTGGQSVDTTSSIVFQASTRDSGVDVHATEVDPIAEAEVYIAYGREAQAEEILREALKKQPERQAIRAKLLDILAGRKDAQAYGALAGEMYEQTGGLNEEWPKIVTMGLALDPDNPLYTGRPAAGGSARTPAAAQDFAGERPAVAPAGTIAAAAAALAPQTRRLLRHRMLPPTIALPRPLPGRTSMRSTSVCSTQRPASSSTPGR
jgi:pilus assembly protein FimV